MLDVIAKQIAHGDGLPFISRSDLPRLVSIDEAILLVDDAMRSLSDGRVDAPERWAMPVSSEGRMGIMPGAAPAIERFGIKVLSLFDGKNRAGLPSHQGFMLLFDLTNGRPLCVVDGTGLTLLRTAAASAVATRALARSNSRSLAILGCGDQARLHVAAIRAVLPISEVTLWNRSAGKAEEFGRQHLQGLAWRVCATPAQAVDPADIICTLTGASEPILMGADLRPGQHVNLVGSSTAGPREVDDALVARARYIADSRDHARSQAAELQSAIANGRVRPDHVAGEIGDVLSGRIPGRLASSDITVYKSLGHIIQDLLVADAAYRAWLSEDRTEDSVENGSGR